MNDARTDRSRVLGLADDLDSGASAPGERAGKFLGRVFDGGSMPTALDRYYLVHPVEVDGTPAEGGPPSYATDTSAAIPVDVIGPEVPAVGDLLTCHRVGGRWVAGQGGGGGEVIVVPPSTCAACFPGNPPGPLTLTDDNSSCTLHFVGSFFDYRWGGNYPWATTGVSGTGFGSCPPNGDTIDLFIGSITMRVGYTVVCGFEPAPALSVVRLWKAFGSDEICPHQHQCGVPVVSYWCDDSIPQASYCPGIFPIPAQPVNVGIGNRPGGIVPTSCSPLVATGTLGTPTPPLVDPAPGPVIITNTPRWLMDEWLGSDDPKERRHAAYRIMVMDDPGKATGHLTREGEFVRGADGARVSTFVMPAPPSPPSAEDLVLRKYLKKHGCCG